MTSNPSDDYQISRLFNYPILATLVFFGAATVWLAASLRPDAFFVGDPGVKLIAAHNAIAHPAHPLNIPLPVLGGQPLPYIEGFFAAHEDHAHAITPELFPLLSAPMIRWLGMRGAYVLPALGFLCILAASAWLAVALDARRRPLVTIFVAALATPFLFYGLEFWEHTPSVAVATFATAAFVRSQKTTEERHQRRLGIVSGVAFGIGILLRPEIACALAGVIIASRWLRPSPRWSTTWPVLGGVAVALLPYEIYTVIHFGSLIPAHIGANSGLLGEGWVAQRMQFFRAWLLPSGWTSAGPTHPSSLWSVAPAALLSLVPLRSRDAHDGRGFLAMVAAITGLLTFLVAPNDGGGQWGPRYLLFAYVPMTILASDVIERMLNRRLAGAVAVLIVLVACIWVQRTAYRQLRGTKITYGRIVDFVSSNVPENGYIVTDLWWLDQIAASAVTDRRMVYAGTRRVAHDTMLRLSAAVVPIVSVVRSQSESPDVGAWTEGTCYVEIERHTLPVRDLVVITLHHRCRS